MLFPVPKKHFPYVSILLPYIDSVLANTFYKIKFILKIHRSYGEKILAIISWEKLNTLLCISCQTVSVFICLKSGSLV